MASFNKSGNLTVLNKMTSYAQELIMGGRVGQLYKRCVICAMMLQRYGMTGELGRPGAFGIFNGKPGMVKAAQREELVAYERKIRVHAQKSSGFKVMNAPTDTSPAVDGAQSLNNTSASYRYWHIRQAIKVDNDSIRFAQGKYRIANPTTEAVEEAMNTLVDNISPYLYLGSPSNPSADKWDQPEGLASLMHTTNTFAGNDRSSAPFSTCWIGKRVTDPTPMSLDLVDEMNITQGAQDTGPGIDTLLMGKANYKKAKAEARSKAQYQALPSMPEHLEVGAKWEGFKVDNVWVLYDPFIQDYSSTNLPGLSQTNISNYVFGLTSTDLHMDVHPDGNFRVTPFKDQGEEGPGGEDAKTANIECLIRPWYEHPDQHVLFTNVS